MTTRDAVVEEARLWLGTPFRMNGALRGVGVDCGRFPHHVFKACGIEVPALPGHWPRDFMCHTDCEPYIHIILQRFHEVEAPEPGDLAVFRPVRSRCFSHTAIVTDWPKFVHARGIGGAPKVETGEFGHWPLEQAEVRFFSAFPLV